MLTVARLATLGAEARMESRGVHFRSDFPDEREELRQHTLVTPRFDGEDPRTVEISSEPVDTSVAVG
jgi:succinate dehydrogenase/fumarate reductase flavoprotein subunit